MSASNVLIQLKLTFTTSTAWSSICTSTDGVQSTVRPPKLEMPQNLRQTQHYLTVRHAQADALACSKPERVEGQALTRQALSIFITADRREPSLGLVGEWVREDGLVVVRTVSGKPQVAARGDWLAVDREAIAADFPPKNGNYGRTEPHCFVDAGPHVLALRQLRA